jgi:uncharacterized Zn-finger protein
MTTQPPQKIYPCPQCFKKFTTKKQVPKHVKSIHEAIENSHICNICGKGFKSKIALIGHKSHTHTNKDFKYSCNHCNLKFKVKCYLTQHLNRVEDAEIARKFKENVKTEPYVCVYCDLVFKSDELRRVHAEIVHCKVYPYPCMECPIRFRNQCT